MERPNRLSDIPVKELYEDATKVEMAEVLGKEIIIQDMTLLSSETGEFAVFLFIFDGEEKQLSTSCGGYRIVQRLVEAKEQGWFPLRANITKEGRAYEVK